MAKSGARGNRLAIGPDGSVEVALAAQHVAQVVEGLDIAGRQGDGAAVGPGRLVQALLQLQRQDQVVVRLGIIGRQGDGAAAGRFGVGGLAQRIQDGAVVGMEGRLVTAHGDGAGDQALGFFEAPRLVGDQAQQMQAVGVVRFALQEPAQKRLRPGGGSSLKVGERLFQECRDGGRRGVGGPPRLALASLPLALQSLASRPRVKGIVSPADCL